MAVLGPWKSGSLGQVPSSHMTVWCACESACVRPVLVSTLRLTFAGEGHPFLFHWLTSAFSRATVPEEAGQEGASWNLGYLPGKRT